MTFVIIALLSIIVFYFYSQQQPQKSKRFRQPQQLSKEEWDEIEKECDITYKADNTIYDKNPDEPNIPEFVKKGRILNKGKKLGLLHKKYLSILPDLMENKPSEVKDLLEKIDESLLVLEPLILHENITWGCFDIKSIPAIENALQYCSVLGLSEKVKSLYDSIKYFPDLNFYEEDAKYSLEFCSKYSEILNYIKENQGAKTKDLVELTDLNPDFLRTQMYYMCKVGVLTKKKIGNYNLYEINKSNTLVG